MIGARGNYRALCGEVCASSLSMVILRSGYRRYAFREWVAWGTWARWGFTVARTMCKVPNTLLGGLASANFPCGNEKCDFESELNDVGKYGHSLDTACILRTDP